MDLTIKLLCDNVHANNFSKKFKSETSCICKFLTVLISIMLFVCHGEYIYVIQDSPSMHSIMKNICISSHTPILLIFYYLVKKS